MDQDRDQPAHKLVGVLLEAELEQVKLALELTEAHQQVALEQVQQAHSGRAQHLDQAKEWVQLTKVMALEVGLEAV